MASKVSRFLRIADVSHLTGMKRSSIYATEDFPKPVKIGERAVGWRSDEIEHWVANLPRVAGKADA